MPMTRDEHEALLDELNNPEIDTSRRNEILHNLRSDYGSFLAEDEKKSHTLDKLQTEKSDLVTANSRLFRQLGISDNPDPETKKHEEQKTLSETITLEDIEKRVGGR